MSERRQCLGDRQVPDRRRRYWFLATALGIASFASVAEAQIRLKSGVDVVVSAQTTQDFLGALGATPRTELHGLVSFTRHPTRAQRESLAVAGITVLTPLLGTVYRARIVKRIDMSAPVIGQLGTNLRGLSTQERMDKTVSEAAEDVLQLLVRIHPGVEGDEVLRVLSPALSKERLSDDLWAVTVAREQREEIGSQDVVQWIDLPHVLKTLPPDQIRAPIRAKDSDLKAAGVVSVQNFNTLTGQALGLSGAGVRVGLFDGGVDENHGDLAPGRVIRPNEARNWHGTHLAGIIAGNGSMTRKADSCGKDNAELAGAAKPSLAPFQWRGVAPNSLILDVEKGGHLALRGAAASVYWELITTKDLGMDVSNHSYDISDPGVYDNNNHDRDRLIRGDATWNGNAVPPRLQVASAGNKGAHFTLTKEMKNALIVANWDTDQGAVHTKTSSRGPTFDGRIKPDVVAPGVQVRAPAFCERPLAKMCGVDACAAASGGVRRQNFYQEATGTSQAAAAVTGVVALMLEEHAASINPIANATAGSPDNAAPLPSTLRGVVIHTAGDPVGKRTKYDNGRQPRKPDLLSGWGLIDADAAVRVIRERRFTEHTLDATCAKDVYEFHVGQGRKAVRVTLAWDDVAADPALADTLPKLVNDLDLVLIDPKGNKHYPWSSAQEIRGADGSRVARGSEQCGVPVVASSGFVPGDATTLRIEKGTDHLNNVEVSDVPVIPGTWRAHVVGFSIPQGPQRYSLIGERFSRPK